MVVFADLLAIFLRLLHRHISHAKDPGLDIETLGHLRAGVLHGHYGYLSHLISTTGNL